MAVAEPVAERGHDAGAWVAVPEAVSLHVGYSKRTHTYRLIGTATEDGQGTRGVVRIFRIVGGGPFITSRAIGGCPRSRTTAHSPIRATSPREVAPNAVRRQNAENDVA